MHETTPGFLSRFISYFDGEKDPRNLMVAFSILKVPMTEWTIGADAQVSLATAGKRNSSQHSRLVDIPSPC